MSALRKVAFAFVTAVALVVVAVAALALYIELKPVQKRDLVSSIAEGVGGASSREVSSCPDREPRVWRCDVDDSEQSGNASTYRVRIRGDRCWAAERDHRYYVNAALKERAQGCVGFWDKVHLLD